MSIAFRAAASVNSGGTIASDRTVSRPAGTVQDDLLIATVVLGSTATITAPSGFTLVRQQTSGSNFRIATYIKFAGASEPSSYTFTFSASSQAAIIMAAYSGVGSVDADGISVQTGTTITAPSVTTTGPNRVVLAMFGIRGNSSISTPSGTTSRHANVSVSNISMRLVDFSVASAGASGAKSATASESAVNGGHQIALREPNNPPHAPTVTSPAPGQTLPRAEPNRITADFNDPDPGDSSSRFRGEVRLSGETTPYYSWNDETPNRFHDIPANELTLGGNELRTWYHDAAGEEGAKSDWVPFTVANRPGPPTIVDPVNGATIGTQEYLVQISASELEAARYQIVGDNDGVPDYDDVYEDVIVNSASSRSRLLPFPDNGVYRWIRVWRLLNGLWSAEAAEHRNPVSWVAPATPTGTATPGDGIITVQASHPTPEGDEPAVVEMHVWRRTADESPSEDRQTPKGAGVRLREGSGLAPSATFVDRVPSSGIVYDHRIQAVGDNGVSSFSDWF